MTPLVITTLAPHQTLSPTFVGPLLAKPCHVMGRSGSSKRWFASVTKQPFANMQWSPISTSSAAATMTAMLTNVPDPIRMRPASEVVSQTFGSNNVCSPTSSRPSRNASNTFPWIGQRANALRRASSRWMANRFQGRELRSYHSHFCHQRRAFSIGAAFQTERWADRVISESAPDSR